MLLLFLVVIAGVGVGVGVVDGIGIVGVVGVVVFVLCWFVSPCACFCILAPSGGGVFVAWYS